MLHLSLAYLVDWGWLRIGPPYISLNINPVLIQLGPLALRWYGLMYVAGIFIGLLTIQRYTERKGINQDQIPGWSCVFPGHYQPTKQERPLEFRLLWLHPSCPGSDILPLRGSTNEGTQEKRLQEENKMIYRYSPVRLTLRGMGRSKHIRQRRHSGPKRGNICDAQANDCIQDA